MIRELRSKSDRIIETSHTYKDASERIMKAVSSKVAAESGGYIVDVYTAFAERIKQEEFFRDPEHLLAFNRLNLMSELNNKYHFEVDSLDAYKKGIDYNEVNRLYASLGTAAGTLALGGILKAALASTVNIPLAVIIGGAVAADCAAYFKIVPTNNKKELKNSVNKFLTGLENDILIWLADIEKFLESRVRTLYTKS